MKRSAWLLAIAALVSVRTARGAGLYFSDRGVRPMGRGGAFVAGADDLGAVWYNPAGLADAKTGLLADFSVLHFSADYTRVLRVVDADDTVRYLRSAKVSGTSPVLPFPTLAASYAWGRRREFTLAGAVYAPYGALATYPKSIGGVPASSRYALGAFDGSAAAFTGAFFAYKPSEQFRIGIGLDALMGFFQSSAIFSMSPPDRLLAAPEQPEYDAASRFRIGPIFAPSGSLGVTWIPLRWLRLGASARLPTVVSSHATLDVRLPTSAVFDSARVVGKDAHVRFKLPAIARAGVEVRPVDELRVEVAYVREFWSIHDGIELTPDDIAIEGAAGLPRRVPVPSVALPRGFQDSNSIRLGGEYELRLGRERLALRAGASYETSAIPADYLSLFTIDMTKVTAALGAGLHVGDHWRFDATYAHVFASSVDVSPDTAKIPRVNPLSGNAPLEAINGGHYSASADLFGLGAEYKF